MLRRLRFEAAMVTLVLVAGLAPCGSAEHAARARPARAVVRRAAGGRARRAGERAGSGATLSPVARGGVVQHGSRRRRWVALTFDADMTYGMRAELRDGRQRSWLDGALFRELRSTRTPATIFLTGLWTRAYRGFVGALARDPLFELENHSLDHAAWVTPCYGLPTVSGVAPKRREVLAAQRSIVRAGAPAPRYFRFPGVCHTARDVRLVERLGLRPVDGDVVSGDAFNPDTAAIVRAVVGGVRPGSIVVAHCIGAPNTPATAAAMARIIPALRSRGYTFVTLARLLRG